MAKYNGFRNYNHWNVSLWINNDEGLYSLAKECGAGKHGVTKDQAAKSFLYLMNLNGTTHTPDGAPYSVSAIRAAMVGM